MASLVLRVSQNLETEDEIVEAAKKILLNVAAPDAIARLSETNLERNEVDQLCELYYKSHFATLSHAIKGRSFLIS